MSAVPVDSYDEWTPPEEVVGTPGHLDCHADESSRLFCYENLRESLTDAVPDASVPEDPFHEIIFDGAQCIRLGRDIIVNASTENHRLAGPPSRRDFNVHMVEATGINALSLDGDRILVWDIPLIRDLKRARLHPGPNPLAARPQPGRRLEAYM